MGDEKEPSWYPVVDELERRIREGVYTPRMQLPTEDEMRIEFGVSPEVIRVALGALAAEKWLESRHRVGHFVIGVPKGFEKIGEWCRG